MRDDDVPVKTHEGLTEIKNRALGLAPRVRTALLLVDGVKSIRELNPLLAASGVKPGTLEILLEKGLISVSSHALVATPVDEEPAEADVIQAPQAAPAVETESIAQAKPTPVVSIVEPAAKAEPQPKAAPALTAAPAAVPAPKAAPEPKAIPEPESDLSASWPVTISVDATDNDLQDRELAREVPVVVQTPKAMPTSTAAPRPEAATPAVQPAARSTPAANIAPKNNEPVPEATKAPQAVPAPKAVPKLEPVMSEAKPLTISVALTEEDPYDQEMVHRVAVAPPPPDDMKLLVARAHLANALDDYVDGYILKQVVTGCTSRAELESLFDAIERVLVKTVGKVRSEDVMGTAKTLLAS